MGNKHYRNEADRCPLCNEWNQCGIDSGDCWCFHLKVPMELRERIPKELKGKACICQKCVESFRSKEA